MKTLEEICENTKGWLKSEHVLDCRIEITKEDEHCNREENMDVFTASEAILHITTEEGDDFYVGNYADPGVAIKLAGEHEGEQMVRVNGIYMSALGRHIAGWAAGYL